MGLFLIRRIGQTLVTLLLVSVIAFSLIQFIPGDPVYTMLGTDISPEYHDQVYHDMGLDKPLPEQYISWLTNLLHYFLRPDHGGQLVALLLRKAFYLRRQYD